MKTYNVYGLRRSGNHFIIEWILEHFKKGYHANEILSNNLPYSHWLYENGKIQEIKLEKMPNGEQVTEENWKNRNFLFDVDINQFNELDVKISSYEDEIPRDIKDNTIIILRDWYNICTSRIKSNRGWENTCKYMSCPNVYLFYCELYKKFPNNFILYNNLVEDENYSKKIEKTFGWKNIPITEKLPQSSIGKGSSFDKKFLNKNNFNKKFDFIKDDKEVWEKITSFESINKYMEEIFDIEI